MNKKELLRYLKTKFSRKIVKAFEKVARENFVPEEYKEYSYEDEPLPIGKGSTISQPYTIAFMLELLELKDNQKILEIGSGSGYVLALINEISGNSDIYGVERIKELAEQSKNRLKQYKNIKVIHKDGSDGLQEYSPYDRILISASLNKIPENIIKQLKINRILIVPVKNSIFKIKRLENKWHAREFPGFVFVPLLEGEE